MKKRMNVGQLLMVGVSGFSLTQSEKEFLTEVQPAGVIYFRRNVQSPNQLIDLTREIRACIKHDPMIGIDQEGGIVARLQNPFTVFPGNEDLVSIIDKAGNEKLLAEKALMMAQELKSVGVNLNFTPVADILTNPLNPIMKGRTFGSDPYKVAQRVFDTIRVYQKQGILSCAKHFPGHGDTMVDSHLELPFVDTELSLLKKRELVPFQKAIEAKVPMMMTAHIRFSRIDPENCATQSSIFLENMLRNKMGFKGIIASDDMEMKAIAHHDSIAQASLKAVHAGCNLILICKDQEKAYQTFELFQNAIETDLVLQERLAFAQKLYRSWKIKYLQPLILRKKKLWGWKAHQSRVASWGVPSV